MSSKAVIVSSRISTDNNFFPIEIDWKGKIKFFISEFAFILIMAFSILLVAVIPEYHSKKVFTSKKNSNFGFTEDPIILIHMTDIHMSITDMHRTDGSSILLVSLCEYKPDLFLLTGDYVDNFKKGQKTGIQNLDDWKMYGSSIVNVLKKKGFQVVDISGNHDQWAVDTFDSKENTFLDNSFIYNRANVKSEEDFFCRKYKLTVGTTDLTFLLINDYRYPVYRPPYGAETHTTSKQLDLLENFMNAIDESEIFVLSHYPVDRAILYKSDKGNSFDDIISNEKVYAIFTGHQHPASVKIVHHSEKGGIEYCTPAAFASKKAGLITLDNGNLVYHEVHIPYYGNKPLFFMTYPIPNEQLTSHHLFNLNNFDIRVISYYPDNTIRLKIEGDINGELTYDHTLNNGAFLFNIYDEVGLGCDINTEFTIGEKYEGEREKFIVRKSFRLALRFIIIPVFIFIFIIIFPFFPEFNFNVVKKVEKLIEGKNINEDFNKKLFYLYLVILSPFLYRNRLQYTAQINKILRYAIFIAFVYPLVLPIHFMQSIKGKVGYSFLVFVVLDNKVKYEHWAVQMTLLYYSTTIFPFAFFASGKKYYNKNNKIIIIVNGFITIALWACSFVINFYTVNQSLYLGFLFFSTAFIFVFITLLVLFIIYFFK